jgi:hypothetical protein
MAFLADPIVNRIATTLIQAGMWGFALYAFWMLKTYE